MNMINNLIGKKSIEKEVKKMKKLIAIAISLALAVSIPAPALAAFGSDGYESFAATVTPTTGTEQIITDFGATLKNISDDTGADGVTWTGVEAQNTDWKAANQYVEVTGFETYTAWGIQIYTDNMAVGASPEYDGTGDPAGLVNIASTGKALSMCWRVVADKKFAGGSEDLGIVQKYIVDDDIYVLLRKAADYNDDDDYYAPWGWMIDKNTDLDPDTAGRQGFGNYYLYATAAGNYGITIAPGNPTLDPPLGTYLPIPSQNSDYHIYLGAKFINAEAGETYTTSELFVEMYHL